MIVDSIYSTQKSSNYKNLLELKDSILQKVRNTGYFGLLEQPIKKINDSTYLSKIKLGRKFTHVRLTSNAIDENSKEFLESTLSRKRNNHIVKSSQLHQRLNELKDYLNNQGYAMAKLQPIAFEFNQTDTVNLTIQITAGSLRKIDRVETKGYSDFPKAYLKAIVKKHQQANQKNITAINDKLNQLPFTEVLKEPELLFKKDSTIMYTYLKRTHNNTADGMIGFNTNQEGNLELNGYLDLILTNNLNTGESLHIIYRGDNEDQTRLNVNLKLPYILRSNIGVQSSLEILRRDSTYQNSKIQAGLFYLPNHQTEIGLSYTSTFSTANDITNTDSSDFNYNGIALNISNQKQSNNPLQLEQFILTTTLQLGSRKTMGTSSNQLRIETMAMKHFKLSTTHSFLTTGHLRFINTEETIFNELYQVGGLNSIRGFNQNAIDTAFFTSVNTEYRIQLSPGIYLHSILDLGYFENFTTKKLENLYSFGIGTGILTNAGLLKLSIANGVFNNAKVDFSSTIAHINLLVRF